MSPHGLLRAYVSESYGYLGFVEEPTLSDVRDPNQNPVAQIRMRLEDYSHHQLLRHDQQLSGHDREITPHTFETATLVFNPGCLSGLRLH